MQGTSKDSASSLLPDGTVLVVGGETNGRVLATAEIYDPGTGT
jgi:hypothetical protein